MQIRRGKAASTSSWRKRSPRSSAAGAHDRSPQRARSQTPSDDRGQAPRRLPPSAPARAAQGRGAARVAVASIRHTKRDADHRAGPCTPGLRAGVVFDELIGRLKRMEPGVRIPIQMPLDDDGYSDRICPSSRTSLKTSQAFSSVLAKQRCCHVAARAGRPVFGGARCAVAVRVRWFGSRR